MQIRERLPHYANLMRLDKPIGVLLLLWPTLWALWFAGAGKPAIKITFIFVTGVFLMRSAGCVVNDLADRNFDAHVERTRNRPLASKKISVMEAIMLAILLGALAFLLVLFCNLLTIKLAFVGAALTVFYPLMKRITHLPQLGLGVAFAWGVPMAFAAQTGKINFAAWWVFAAAVIWPVIYDTMYAMVDRNDDLKIGIKSTAILFANRDRFFIAILQLLFVLVLMMMGKLFHLHGFYFVNLGVVAILFIYQQWLIRNRDRDACFQAFLNNNWVGLVIFVGILLSYWS